MGGVGRHVRGWLLALGSIALPGGCGASDLNAPCRSDDDCDTGERCDASTARTAEPIYGPCQYTTCFAPEHCSNGYVCEPVSPDQVSNPTCGSMLCVPPCDPVDQWACPTGKLCRDDGHCTLVQCDDPGGITCPAHWRCDPQAATSEPNGRPNVTFGGSTVMDPTDVADLIAHGCVRERCYEDYGYACHRDYTCKESEATNGTGCVATPCEELGHCADDERYICTPTSSAPRPSTTDVHGCVTRNCEEGRLCSGEASPGGFCDSSHPSADSFGCAVVPCTEGNPCPFDWVCDPNGRSPNSQGCDIPFRGDAASGDEAGNGRCVAQ